MFAKRGRLDRLLSAHFQVPRRDIRTWLVGARIQVDGVVVKDPDFQIDEFSVVACDGIVFQENHRQYWMLHKPIGVVSATWDAKHATVIDLLECPNKDQLHIAGRLDLNSSGLLLLTNDSRWSQALTAPEQKVSKVYQVRLQNPLVPEMVDAFAKGMYFEYEDHNTLPAQLEIVGTHSALVTLSEGKYHQIKRMFGRFRNPVLAIHRQSIGAIQLDATLSPGQSRQLTLEEVQSIQGRHLDSQ
jgi:16S rRNA pseudouridine516 synthase